MADIINIEVQEELNPIVEIKVDENSAQSAIDAAAAAQAILDQINDLVLPDELLYIDEIIKDGNNRTIPAGVVGRIDGVIYTSTVEFNYTVNSADIDKKRIDKIVFNKLSSFQYLIGVPSSDIVEVPDTPNNTLFVGLHYVFGAEVNDEAPVAGSQYLEKSYFSTFLHNSSGIIGTLLIDGKWGGVKFSGAVTKLGGFQRNTSEFVLGMPFFIENAQAIDIELTHMDAASNVKNYFYTETNKTIKQGEVFYFLQTRVGANFVNKFIGSSAGGGTITEAPIDGNPYVRQDGGWEDLKPALNAKLSIFNNINSNTTAPLNSHLNVIGDCAITSPTPVAGKGYYEVNVVNGVATIDGVAYGVGSLVMRTWHVASWKTTWLFNGQKFKTILTSQDVDDSFDGCIVKIKATATLTLIAGLNSKLAFTCDAYAGVTATFASASGVTKYSVDSKYKLLGDKMCTVYADGLDNYRIKGELSL